VAFFVRVDVDRPVGFSYADLFHLTGSKGIYLI
jgi:hypothetical protein